MRNMPSENRQSYWFLFSIADVLFLSILFVILYRGTGLLGGGDAGFHIRIGDYIIAHGAIPTHDIFAAAGSAQSWVPSVWLADVIASLLHRVGGLSALVVSTAIVLAATHVLLFFLFRAQGVNLLMAVAFTILGAATSGIHWLARPHTVSFLFLVIWYMTLDGYQNGRNDRLLWLPVITLFWVNIHGSFIIGLAILGIYALSNSLYHRYCSSERAVAGVRARKLWIVLLACFAASLVNPQGYKILLQPFQTALDPFVVKSIIEWRSPNFHEILGFEVSLLLTLLVLSLSIRRLSLLEIALVLLFTHMSLYAARFVPLFAFIVLPIVARHAEELWQSWNQGGVVAEIKATSGRMAAIDAMTRGHLWSLAGVVVASVLCLTGVLKYGFVEAQTPVAAVEFLKSEDVKGNIFNTDVFGNYMIYVGGLKCERFCDGRDSFGPEKAKAYLEIIGVEPGWETALDKYDISWVMYKTDGVLTTILLKDDDWTLVHSDPVASIFARKTPANQAIIRKYPNVQRAVTSKDEQA